MKRSLTIIACVALCLPCFAKPKEKTYSVTCEKVWAAVKTASAPPHYNFAQLDDATHKGIVSTGNNLTGKRYLDITLTGSGDSCTVALGGVYSGLVHNDKGDFFGRIDEALASTATPAAASQASTSVTTK